MKTKVQIRKDSYWNKAANSRSTIIVMLIIVVIYVGIANRILNEPSLFLFIRSFIAVTVVAWLFYKRRQKFRDYYSRKMKDTVFIIIAILWFCMASFILQLTIAIPNYLVYLLWSRSATEEYHACKITNYTTTGINNIRFSFKGESCSRYFYAKGISRKELLKDYVLIIGVKKSLSEVYCLESFELQVKE